MADTSLALVKRKRKQAWRQINQAVRSLQTSSQAAMRYSQKVLNQPSTVGPEQLKKLTGYMAQVENNATVAGQKMGILLTLFNSGY